MNNIKGPKFDKILALLDIQPSGWIKYPRSTIYSAVAYLRMEDETADYVEKKGLFVIRSAGDRPSLSINKGFKPKVFA